MSERVHRGRPIRVLFALPGLHRVNRGAEVAFECTAAELARTPGFEVTLIGAGQPREGQPYAFRHAGFLPRERFVKWPKVPPFRSEYAWEELTYAWNLRRAYRPDEFDVSIGCSYPFTNWTLRRGRKSGGPKCVFVTQNGDWCLKERRREYRFFDCDGVVATNPEYFATAQARYASALIPNGVDTMAFDQARRERAMFGMPEDRPVVLFVAALIESKRVMEGIRVAAQIPEAFLFVAGDGPLKDEVERLLAEVAPGRHVRTTIPREQMPHAYRSADVLLHMSKTEPFGNIYIEALAAGTPVVAHETTSTKWITQGQAALVNSDDAIAVVEALRAAFEGRAPGTRESRAAMVRGRFSWRAVGDQYAEFLRKVCGVGGAIRES